MKTNWVSSLKDNGLVKYAAGKIAEFHLTDDMIVRMRILLFLTSVLAFYLAFEMGDDWYVREFANYDWARHIGY